MTTFLVERYLPGWPHDRISQLVTRIRAIEFGPDVAYCGSIVLPGDETCLCVFEAAGEAQVVTANATNDLPVGRVVLAEARVHAPSGSNPS